MSRTVDIRVLGGLPVTVEFTTAKAEPDVGLMSDYVDEWWITHVSGKKVKDPQWLYKKIDQRKIVEQIYSNME